MKPTQKVELPHILMIKQEIWYLLPMKREEQILMLTTRQEI
ncbi:hypothetical protein [Agathobacter rectalis]|nr:hypothetical protein [Agathobacter rectalis]